MSPQQHPYTRSTVKSSDRLLIESCCDLCGFKILGSATETLAEQEKLHAQRCSKVAKPQPQRTEGQRRA